MSFVATQIARRVWFAMLWFMRRQWMRRLQRGSVKFFPEGPRRERAWGKFRRQERFARKYGLKILTVTLTLCLYFVVLLVIYNFLTIAIEQGWLPVRPIE